MVRGCAIFSCLYLFVQDPLQACASMLAHGAAAKGVGFALMSRYLAFGWLAVFTSLISQTLGQAGYKLEANENAGAGIYVAMFQEPFILCPFYDRKMDMLRETLP